MQPHSQKKTLLRRTDVEQRTGLKRSAIYARMKEGAFPKSVPLGGRSVAWVEEEIESWIEGRIEQRQSMAA